MLIEVSASGGFGGLPAATTTRALDLEQLSEDRCRAYSAAFEPKALAEISQATPSQGRADTMTYEITVIDADGERHLFKIDETLLPPDLLDLIDDMPKAADK